MRHIPFIHQALFTSHTSINFKIYVKDSSLVSSIWDSHLGPGRVYIDYLRMRLKVLSHLKAILSSILVRIGTKYMLLTHMRFLAVREVSALRAAVNEAKKASRL